MASCIQPRKTVKVRKNHVCQGCGIIIKTKEQCTYSKHADGGEIYSFYECNKCSKFYDENCNKCKDFQYCIGENYFVGSLKECQVEINRQ